MTATCLDRTDANGESCSRCIRIYQVKDRRAKDTVVQGLELPEEASRSMSRDTDLAESSISYHKPACF